VSRNRRWWVSWYQTGDDTRPLTWPLPSEVAGYWRTGYGARGDTLCAVVDAPTEEKAKAKIDALWGNGGRTDWRFVEPRDSEWEPSPDRFPRSKANV